jgi:hypothetical protein
MTNLLITVKSILQETYFFRMFITQWNYYEAAVFNLYEYMISNSKLFGN